MKRLLAVLAFLPFAAFASTTTPEKTNKTEAPATTLHGSIADASNYKPLGKVQLTLTSTNADVKKTLQTDEQGKFAVDNLPAGTYKISFEKNGYEPGGYPSLTVKEGTDNSFGFVLFED